MRETTHFGVTEAGNWCSETLGFNSNWDIVLESETWNYVELLSENFDFQYAYICEDPVFTISFDDEERAYDLAHHDNEYFDEIFPVHSPVSGDFRATLSITAANGGSLFHDVAVEAYEPVCYVSEVFHERLDILYGNSRDDDTILSLSLSSSINGNCGDGILYTLDYNATPFNIMDGER